MDENEENKMEMMEMETQAPEAHVHLSLWVLLCCRCCSSDP